MAAREKKLDTWMPLYIGDYLADTMHLTTQQHGAYLLLLMHQWRTGPLPNDDAQLAAISRCDMSDWKKRIAPAVRQFFNVTPQGLSQKRCEEERQRTSGVVEKRKTSGTGGGRAKWGETEAAEANRAQRLSAARKLGTHTAFEWEALRAFCGNRCARCDQPDAKIVKDHIVPIYKGGSDAIDNLQPLCGSCNSSKGPECTDWRKSGWQDAIQDACEVAGKMPSKTPGKTPGKMPGKMPGKTPAKRLAKRLANACEMPTNHSHSNSKRFSSSDSLNPRASGDPPKPPCLGDPPEAWAPLADKMTRDFDGTVRPAVNGTFLDKIAKRVCEAAGITDPEYRGEWGVIVGWLRDGVEEEPIVAVVRQVASNARSRGQKPASLRYFDKAVREHRSAA